MLCAVGPSAIDLIRFCFAAAEFRDHAWWNFAEYSPRNLRKEKRFKSQTTRHILELPLKYYTLALKGLSKLAFSIFIVDFLNYAAYSCNLVKKNISASRRIFGHGFQMFLTSHDFGALAVQVVADQMLRFQPKWALIYRIPGTLD